VKKILALYRKTLKPLAIEEIFDVYFFRIFSFILVLPLNKTKFSPTYFTLLSMISGITSGIFFAQGNYKGLLYGALALGVTNIFDCADGQLARLTQKNSKFGKTLDGLADLITYISIYTGISWHLYVQGYPIWIFIYGFISMMFMFIHIIYFDHFKNEYISYVHPKYNEKSEKLDELEKKYTSLKKKNDSKWILAYLYFLFYKIEYLLVSFSYPENYKGYHSIYDNKRKPTNKIIINYSSMKNIVRLWTFFGATSHIMIFLIFAILNIPLLIFHFISIIYNIALVTLILIQKKKFKTLFNLSSL